MKKSIFLIFIFLTLSNCGFAPIYSESNKSNFAIEIIETKGDGIVNNIIKSEIARISSANPIKKYKIKINTNYEKIVLSKDTKGIVSNYQVILDDKLIIQHNETNEEIVFQEKQNIKNNNNTFDQKNYEKMIKRNFAISMVRKLNLELLNKK